MGLPTWATVTASTLLGVAFLALWGWMYVGLLSSIQEHRAQHQLYGTFEENLSAGTDPPPLNGGSVAQRTPMAVMAIPRLGVRKLTVVEGTTSGDLELGPGHRRDTPFPGEEGTSYIFGRSATYGAPFARLGTLRKGDTISITTGEGQFSFLVDAVRRAGDPLSAFLPGAARLTLVTSEAAKGGLRQVLYVDATLKGHPVQAYSGRPTSLDATENQMSGDTGVWFSVVLWLEGLLVAVALLAWMRVRWSAGPVTYVGVPVILALLWGLTAAVVQLLPNLY